MQVEPNTGFVPQLEVMTTGLAATAAQIAGQVGPGDACLDHEQNARVYLAVVQRLAFRESESDAGVEGESKAAAVPKEHQ